MVQHLTKGGWGVLVRRVPEHFMNNIGLMAILFLPILWYGTCLPLVDAHVP